MTDIVWFLEGELGVLGTLRNSSSESGLLCLGEISELCGEPLPLPVQLHEALHVINHMCCVLFIYYYLQS